MAKVLDWLWTTPCFGRGRSCACYLAKQYARLLAKGKCSIRRIEQQCYVHMAMQGHGWPPVAKPKSWMHKPACPDGHTQPSKVSSHDASKRHQQENCHVPLRIKHIPVPLYQTLEQIAMDARCSQVLITSSVVRTHLERMHHSLPVV